MTIKGNRKERDLLSKRRKVAGERGLTAKSAKRYAKVVKILIKRRNRKER